MNLEIFQPSDVVLNINVSKVIAESYRGSFCILPRHIDTVTALVPGILTYTTENGKEKFLALNGGILVKHESHVSIVTPLAIHGELGTLKKNVEKLLTEVDDREKKARTTVASLEANFVRRFLEFGKHV